MSPASPFPERLFALLAREAVFFAFLAPVGLEEADLEEWAALRSLRFATAFASALSLSAARSRICFETAAMVTDFGLAGVSAVDTAGAEREGVTLLSMIPVSIGLSFSFSLSSAGGSTGARDRVAPLAAREAWRLALRELFFASDVFALGAFAADVFASGAFALGAFTCAAFASVAFASVAFAFVAFATGTLDESSAWSADARLAGVASSACRRAFFFEAFLLSPAFALSSFACFACFACFFGFSWAARGLCEAEEPDDSDASEVVSCGVAAGAPNAVPGRTSAGRLALAARTIAPSAVKRER